MVCDVRRATSVGETYTAKERRVFMEKIKTIVADKRNAIVVAITSMATQDGVAMPPKTLMDTLSNAYLLVVQCLWVRNIDIAFIKKYGAIAPRVALLLKKFDFNDIVRTMRAKYTNLYTQKTSKGRTYNLNFETFSELVAGLESGKIVIYKKKSVKNTQGNGMAKQNNSFSSQLFNSFAQQTSTPTQKAVAATPKTPKTSPKVEAKPKEKPIQKGHFDAIAVKDMVVGKFYRIAVKNNDKKLYVWFDSVANAGAINVRDYKKVVVAVKLSDIIAVEAYTKAIYAVAE